MFNILKSLCIYIYIIYISKNFINEKKVYIFFIIYKICTNVNKKEYFY